MTNQVITEGIITYIICDHEDGTKNLAAINTSDLERVSSVAGKWKSHRTYSSAKQPYVMMNGKDNKTLYLHRFLTDCPAHLVVDHVNGNALDNRRSNLNITTQQQNCAKRELGNTGIGQLQVRNVTQRPGGKYQVRVCGKYMGMFATLDQAETVAIECRTKINYERVGRAEPLNQPNQ